MRKNSVFIGVGFLLIIFVIFLIRGGVFLDPDFGWHLRMGEIIRESGIPKGDPLSYTMPTFGFVDHEWLTNVSISYIYSIFGMWGLAVCFSLFAVLAITFSLIRTKEADKFHQRIAINKFIPNIAVLLSFSVLLPFFGVRPQVLSWFFLAIILWILFKKWNYLKARFAVVPLILLWTNMHGSFAIGVGVLSLFIFIKSVRRRRFEFSEIAVLLASFAVTFLNPYGVRLWGEVWMQLSDTSLRWSISEWMPAILMVDFSFISLLVLSISLIYRYRSKFTIEELSLFFLVLFSAILSRRHVPLWVIVGLPMTTACLSYFYDEVKLIKQANMRLKKVYIYAWVGTLVIFSSQAFFSLRSAYLLTEDKYYPSRAVVYLQIEMPKGNIFSEYGWGGYLNWKLPQKRVFIDGRMPSWKWDKNPEGELGNAFDTYTKLLEGKTDYKQIFNTFNVDYVLWPKVVTKGAIDILAQRIENFFVKDDEKEEFVFLEQLGKDGWLIVYEDSVSAIYRRSD